MKSFFNLTKNERKGVFVFSAFLVFVFIGKSFFQKESASSFSISPEKTAIVEKPIEVSFQKKVELEKLNSKKTISIPDTFFNPNNFAKSDWIAMGFSEKQSQVFCNFISKKGGLKSGDEILKVYGVAPEYLEKLQGQIKIPTRLFSLNQISKEQLESAKGIGEVLSARILKYREKLGGFYSVDQLQEVYGVKTEVVDEVKKISRVDSQNIKKLRINFVSYDELKNHPYLKEKEVKKIIQIRSESPIADFTQLFSVISDSARVKKLKPYLKYD